MCDFYSWGERKAKDGSIKYLYLTDDIIEAKWGKVSLDVIGHRAIAKYHKIKECSFEHHEGLKIAPALVSVLNSGACDKMARLALAFAPRFTKAGSMNAESARIYKTLGRDNFLAALDANTGVSPEDKAIAKEYAEAYPKQFARYGINGEIIASCFTWSNTPQGRLFWSKLRDAGL